MAKKSKKTTKYTKSAKSKKFGKNPKKGKVVKIPKAMPIPPEVLALRKFLTELAVNAVARENFETDPDGSMAGASLAPVAIDAIKVADADRVVALLENTQVAGAVK